jgi:hypothetical protein
MRILWVDPDPLGWVITRLLFRRYEAYSSYRWMMNIQREHQYSAGRAKPLAQSCASASIQTCASSQVKKILVFRQAGLYFGRCFDKVRF